MDADREVHWTRTVIWKAAEAWSEDAVPRLAAAFSFYAVLSMAPLLVLAIAMAGFLFESSSVRAHLLLQVNDALGPQTRDLTSSIIDNTYRGAQSEFATVTSLVVTFFAASNLFLQLQQTFNAIWGIEEKKRSLIRMLLVSRVKAFLGVLTFGAIALSWMTVDTWMQWIELRTSTFLAWPIVSALVSALLLSGIFAISYRAMPRGHVKWEDTWFGAMVAGCGISLAKYLLIIYFGFAHVAGAFGPAGAIVLILLWVYYTSQIYFFGAEIVYCYAHCRGSRKHIGFPKSPERSSS